ARLVEQVPADLRVRLDRVQRVEVVVAQQVEAHPVALDGVELPRQAHSTIVRARRTVGEWTRASTSRRCGGIPMSRPRTCSPPAAPGIRTHQAALSGARALAANAARAGLQGAYRSHALDAALLDGARVVLLRLPRSLDALDEAAEAIARWAAADVRVYASGMV